MTLVDLLQKVSKNPELKVRIVNDDGSDIVTFNAAGYPAVNDELNAREVEKIIFAEDMRMIKIYLTPVPEPTPDPDPTDPNNDPTDPSNDPDPNNP